MGRPAQNARLAALLLLLVAACASASSQPARPSVMDTLRAAGLSKAGGPAHVSTASIQADEYGYDSGYHTEEKEICLQEGQRTGCFGGAEIDETDPANPAFVAYQPGGWTSELTCCDSHEHYSSSHGIGHFGASLISPYNTMGVCDWNIALVYTGVGGGKAQVSPGIWRIGSATATCYLGADSDKCGGGVFCEHMVMSLQGSVYEIDKAYSHYGRSATYVDSTVDDDCADVIFGWQGTLIPRIGQRGGSGQRAGNGTSSRGMTNVRHSHSRTQKSAMRQPAAVAAASAAARPASQFAETQEYGGGHQHDNRVVYYGAAIVINGMVTAMSSPRKEKWEDGTFEYVAEFFGTRTAAGAETLATLTPPQPVVGALEPNIPWVRDKTYKFTFYKGSQYSK